VRVGSDLEFRTIAYPHKSASFGRLMSYALLWTLCAIEASPNGN